MALAVAAQAVREVACAPFLHFMGDGALRVPSEGGCVAAHVWADHAILEASSGGRDHVPRGMARASLRADARLTATTATLDAGRA